MVRTDYIVIAGLWMYIDVYIYKTVVRARALIISTLLCRSYESSD